MADEPGNAATIGQLRFELAALQDNLKELGERVERLASSEHADEEADRDMKKRQKDVVEFASERFASQRASRRNPLFAP